MSNNPSLDILMAAPLTARALERAVDGMHGELRTMAGRRAVSFVVSHGGPAPTSHVQRWPEVRWLESRADATLPALWGRAIGVTGGDIVAIVDADCPVQAGWLQAAFDAIDAGRPIVGGAVEPNGLRSPSAWAAYFCDYGFFLPPVAEGPSRWLAGNNLLLLRMLFAEAPRYVAPEFWKVHFLTELERRGLRGWTAPRLVVRYEKALPLGAWLRRRARHARCFGAMRTISSWRRPLYGLLAPALPPLLYFRLAKSVLPKHRFAWRFMTSTPCIAAGLAAWVVGETIGYWRGAARSCQELV